MKNAELLNNDYYFPQHVWMMNVDKGRISSPENLVRLRITNISHHPPTYSEYTIHFVFNPLFGFEFFFLVSPPHMRFFFPLNTPPPSLICSVQPRPSFHIQIPPPLCSLNSFSSHSNPPSPMFSELIFIVFKSPSTVFSKYIFNILIFPLLFVSIFIKFKCPALPPCPNWFSEIHLKLQEHAHSKYISFPHTKMTHWSNSLSFEAMSGNLTGCRKILSSSFLRSTLSSHYLHIRQHPVFNAWHQIPDRQKTRKWLNQKIITIFSHIRWT